MCLTDVELDELETDIENLPDLYRGYQKALKAAHKMDYDDQLCFALQILRGAPAVAAAFRKRYKYFCVDESQDTSKVQHEIIRVLAQESGNIFMVGDEDQSIYGFRAAYPQALMDFEKTSTLQPGASQTITMKVDLANLASYDANGAKTYILDAGTYYATTYATDSMTGAATTNQFDDGRHDR